MLDDADAGFPNDGLRPENEFPPFYPAYDCLSLIAEFERRGCRRLATRLETCLKRRRRELRGSDVRVTFPACGLVCCERCVRQHVYRWRQSRSIKRAFGNARNEDCSLVTIHAHSRTLEGLHAENQQLRRDCRGFRAC